MKSCNKTNFDIKNIKMYFEIEGKNLTFFMVDRSILF